MNGTLYPMQGIHPCNYKRQPQHWECHALLVSIEYAALMTTVSTWVLLNSSLCFGMYSLASFTSHFICNGNRTEWSTIQGVIRRVISNQPSARLIWNYELDYSLNCTTRSPITN